MILKHISVKNFGSLSFYDADLTPELNIIETRSFPELTVAMECLLCSRTRRGVPSLWIRDNTQLSAQVLLEEMPCVVEAVPVAGVLKLTATDLQGNDVTDFYRHTLSHCPEQDAAEGFDGQDKTLPFRLCWYQNSREYDACANLSRRTAYFADTKTFRNHLLRYIHTFQPQPIHSKKNYKAAINPQGKFEVIHPDVPGEVFLSTTEEKLFLYLCFLNIAEFWTDMEKIRDLHHEKKPLLIRNFLEHLDESTDMRGLVDRTSHLQRQVILLTLPTGEEIKSQWLSAAVS